MRDSLFENGSMNEIDLFCLFIHEDIHKKYIKKDHSETKAEYIDIVPK